MVGWLDGWLAGLLDGGGWMVRWLVGCIDG